MDTVWLIFPSKYARTFSPSSEESLLTSHLQMLQSSADKIQTFVTTDAKSVALSTQKHY